MLPAVVVVSAAAVAVGLATLSAADEPAAVPTDFPSTSVTRPPTTTTTPAVVLRREMAEFGISLELPWGVGENGWVDVTAADASDGFAGVLDTAVNNDLEPFGSSPTIRELVVDGAEGRLVLPSGDAPESRGFPEGAVFIELGPDVSIPAGDLGVLIVSSDVKHIEAIAVSIRFLLSNGGS